MKRALIVVGWLAGAFLVYPGSTVRQYTALARWSPPCEQPGWFPTEFGLKDHTVFWYAGYYYLASINVYADNRFAYGRSLDLCTWETLPPILTTRTPGTWDASAIWAPFVFQEDGIFYMLYTGVTADFTQSILLATSQDPSDPGSWQEQGFIFKPHHPGMLWVDGQWADCRDPTVIKVNGLYYLYYTGEDTSGGIVGLATAAELSGPWIDWGAVLPAVPGAALESPTIVPFGDAYYLFYYDTTSTERYRIGATAAGPWLETGAFGPGWGNEVWQSQDGSWFTSYLTDYTVTISALTWDAFFVPSRPLVGKAAYHLTLPHVMQTFSNGQ
jgi:hypothetical protein